MARTTKMTNAPETLAANVFDLLLADRKTTAAADLAAYPQYRGRHDDGSWTLLRARREVKTKMGVAVIKGEYVLGKFEERDLGAGMGRVATFYSCSNKCHTVVSPATFSVVEKK